MRVRAGVDAVMRRIAVCSLVLCASLTWPASGHADRATAKQLFERGRAAEDRGESDEALALYQRAIVEDADFAPAYRRATPMWMQRGAFDVAIRALERFSLRYPKQAFAWYALAYAYRRTGRPEYAALSYESYIALRPQDATPYFGLGMVRLDMGDAPGARDAFTTYVRMEREPARAPFVEQAHRELVALGEPVPNAPAATSAAAGTPRRTTQENAPSASGARRVAESERSESGLREVALMAAEGRHEEALARAQSVHSEEPRARLQLAVWRAHSLVAIGRFEEAKTVLWAILAASPTHVSAYRMLADIDDNLAQ